MMARIRRIWADQRAASGAEFALVLPLALVFLLGTIDAGRLLWTWNRAEKATQMGVRYAVVTAPVPSGLAGFSFVGTSGLTPGDTVPTSAYGSMTCSKPSTTVVCTCTGTCPWGTAASSAVNGPFDKIYNRMRLFAPELRPEDIEVRYVPSGLGFAGDPNGPDIAPLVRVSIKTLIFRPVSFALFKGSITIRGVSAALTMEDAMGTTSN